MAPFARSPMSRDQRDFDRSIGCILLHRCSARATEPAQERTVAHGHRSSVLRSPDTNATGSPASNEFARAVVSPAHARGDPGLDQFVLVLPPCRFHFLTATARR